MKWRDRYIPLLVLGELFGCPGYQREEGEGLVVVVESDGRQCGLVVDELTSHQQIVVKSLEANYRKVDDFSGATILGDGSVALIIDVATLLARARSH